MLLDKIQSDLALGQKARDQVRVDTLRFLLGAIFNLQIEKYPPSKGGPPVGGMTDEDVLLVVAKQVKTHNESIEMFAKGKRDDLVEREKAELAILMVYLPAQMSEDEVRAKVLEIKEKSGISDFGQLMKLVMGELKGKADGSIVSKILRETP